MLNSNYNYLLSFLLFNWYKVFVETSIVLFKLYFLVGNKGTVFTFTLIFRLIMSVEVFFKHLKEGCSEITFWTLILVHVLTFDSI